MRVVRESTTRAEQKFVMGLEKEEPSSSHYYNISSIFSVTMIQFGLDH